MTMERSLPSGEIRRLLASVPPFVRPDAALEQVATPVEAAMEMLRLAASQGDLEGRHVLDLGCGTGRLTLGALLFGARRVSAVDADAGAVALARKMTVAWKPRVSLHVGPVGPRGAKVDTVLMNPPFGAQRRGADRPFWDAAFARARRRIYSFASAESRTFIARRTVGAGAYVESLRPVRWDLPRLFPYHRKDRVALNVDLWVIRGKENP